MSDKRFTEEQFNELKEIFALFDKDHDGRINVSDLSLVMKSVGANPTDIELRDMISAFGPDGSVTLSSFLSKMAERLPPPPKPMDETNPEEMLKPEDQVYGGASVGDFMEEVLQAAFRRFDAEGTGFLSGESLKRVMAQLGGENLTDQEIEEIIQEADIDGDQRISYEEFVKVVMS